MQNRTSGTTVAVGDVDGAAADAVVARTSLLVSTNSVLTFRYVDVKECVSSLFLS